MREMETPEKGLCICVWLYYLSPHDLMYCNLLLYMYDIVDNLVYEIS